MMSASSTARVSLVWLGCFLLACSDQGTQTPRGDGGIGRQEAAAGDGLTGDQLVFGDGGDVPGSDAAAELAPAVCGGDAGIYVSPAGSGSSCGPLAPCALEQAIALVRQHNSAMSADLTVCLHGGRYELAQTLVLGPADSGSNGYNVVYRAFPGARPVLSGARTLVGPWALHDAGQGIYKLAVAGANSRQLVVNGSFALRARGPLQPAGFTKTASGYSTSGQPLAGISKPQDLEIVSHVEWKSFRCGVAAVAGDSVTVEQPCWNAANWHEARPIGLPAWIENALEYLDAPGEWYLDQQAGQLYYKPRAGEDLAQAEVLLPQLESLLELAGSAANPVRDIHFVGLTFAHNTWLAPSAAEGYAPLQAGLRLIYVGNDPTPAQRKSAAALTLRYAQGVRFSGNTFTLLGSAGLALETGSRHNVIIENTFSALAASALQLSDVQPADHHPASPQEAVLNNVIRGNLIRQVGLDYHDSLGIWAGYAGQTHVLQNELSALPYSAISFGWGWGAVDVGGAAGYTTPTPAQQNRIEGNKIFDLMGTLRDGGGVYVLGAQAGSVIRKNSIAEQHSDYAAIYLDNGARYFTVSENVVWQAPHWAYVQGWGTKALDNTLTGNFYDAACSQLSQPPPNETHPSNVVAQNEKVYLGLWPAAAQTIIAAAGIESDLSASRPVAGQARATGSSEYSAEHGASRAIDGQAATGWSPGASDAQPWLQLDLGTPLQLRQVAITLRQDLDQPESRQDFELRVSNDPAFGSYLALGGQGSTPLPHQASFSVSSERTSAFRYLRLAKTKPGYLYVAELAVEAVP